VPLIFFILFFASTYYKEMQHNQQNIYENFNHHFNELKQCQAADVSAHIMSILENFPFTGAADRETYARVICQFAELHREEKPLLFAYASLVKSFNEFYLERYEMALPMLAETEKLFNEQNDLNGAASCVAITGSIYRTFGTVDQSLKSMWAAHEQVKSDETFLLFTMASGVTVAHIYLDQKHYDDAIKLFNEMLQLPQKHFKFYWDVYALHGLGKIYLAQKKPEEALSCFNAAVSLAEKHKHPLSICNSLSELGNYYFTIGDLEKSEDFYKRSLTLREQYKFSGGAVTSCIRLGEIYIKQSRTDEALRMLDKGLSIAGEIKVKPKIFQIHYLLSALYESRNEIEKSLYHFKKFHALHDEVEATDNARKVKNVKTYFEAEQTKKENAIIKRQKEEIERKNIELQETIDELTRARIGKKARAITLLIAIVLFIFEDSILHFALTSINTENYFISMAVKMTLIFSLAPINKAIEKYLLKKVIKKKKEVLVPVQV
jgi:tetratricopeptide (TPR) repeat protein